MTELRFPGTKTPAPQLRLLPVPPLLFLLCRDSCCQCAAVDKLVSMLPGRLLEPPASPEQRATSLACYISAPRKQCMPRDHKQQYKCYRSQMIDATRRRSTWAPLTQTGVRPASGHIRLPQTLTQGEVSTARAPRTSGGHGSLAPPPLAFLLMGELHCF